MLIVLGGAWSRGKKTYPVPSVPSFDSLKTGNRDVELSFPGRFLQSPFFTNQRSCELFGAVHKFVSISSFDREPSQIHGSLCQWFRLPRRSETGFSTIVKGCCRS